MKVVGALFLLLGLANAGFENFHAHPAFLRSTDESIFTVRPRHLPLPSSFYQSGPIIPSQATPATQIPYLVRESNLPVVQQFSPINQLQTNGAPVNLVRYVILREYQFDGQGFPTTAAQSPSPQPEEQQRSAPEATSSETPVNPAAPEEQRSILAQPQGVQIPAEAQPQGGYEESRAQIVPQPIVPQAPQQEEQAAPAPQQEQVAEQQSAAQEQVETNAISSEESAESQSQTSAEPERPNIVFSVIPAIGVDLGSATLPSRAELRAQYQQQEQQAREAEPRPEQPQPQQPQVQAQSGYIGTPEQQGPIEQARLTAQAPQQIPEVRVEQQRQEIQPQQQIQQQIQQQEIQQQQPQQQEQIRSQFQQRPLNEYMNQMVEQAPFMQQPAQMQAQFIPQMQQTQQGPFMQYPDISAQMQEAFLRSRLTSSEPIVQSQGYEVSSNFNLEQRAQQQPIPQQEYEQQQPQQQQQIIEATRSAPAPVAPPQQPQQIVQAEPQFRAAPIPESPVLTQSQYTLPIVQQDITRDDSHHADDNENPPNQEQAAGYNGIEASPAPNPLLRSGPVVTRVSDDTNRMALDQALRLIADLARAAQRGNQFNLVQQPEQPQPQQPSPVSDFSITPSVETEMGGAREGRRISPRLIVGQLPQVRAMPQPQQLLRYY